MFLTPPSNLYSLEELEDLLRLIISNNSKAYILDLHTRITDICEWYSNQLSDANISSYERQVILSIISNYNLILKRFLKALRRNIDALNVAEARNKDVIESYKRMYQEVKSLRIPYPKSSIESDVVRSFLLRVFTALADLRLAKNYLKVAVILQEILNSLIELRRYECWDQINSCVREVKEVIYCIRIFQQVSSVTYITPECEKLIQNIYASGLEQFES